MLRYLNHPHFFLPHHAVRGLSPLIANQTLRGLTLSLAGIFAPLYVLKLTGDFGLVLGFFILNSLASLLADLPAAHFIARKGFTHSMSLAGGLLFIYITLLLLAGSNPMLLIPAALVGGFCTAPYWLPYHTLFSVDGKKDAFAREVGWVGIISQLCAAAGPLIGGLVISFWGFSALYFVSLILVFLSLITLLFFPDHPKPEAPKVSDLCCYAKSDDGRKWFLTFWLAIFEQDTLAIVWPVFVFAAVGSYETVGGIASASLLVSLILLFVSGQLADRLGRNRILKYGSLGTAMSWLILGSARGGGAIFGFSALLKSARTFLSVPLDAYTYERASKGWAFKFLTFREMALHSGSFILLLILLIIWKLDFPPAVYFFPAIFGSFGIFLLSGHFGDFGEKLGERLRRFISRVRSISD